jgi:hypothetical protein
MADNVNAYATTYDHPRANVRKQHHEKDSGAAFQQSKPNQRIVTVTSNSLMLQ